MNYDAHDAGWLEQPVAFTQERLDRIRVSQMIDEMLGKDAWRTPGG